MTKKTIMEIAGEALLEEYDISLVSCTDREGKTYTSFRGKGEENMTPEAFLNMAANIVSIALDVAQKNGINEEEFWQGMKASVADTDTEKIKSSQEAKNEPWGVVIQFPTKS